MTNPRPSSKIPTLTLWLNVSLCLLSLSLVLFYVVVANRVAAQRYLVQTLDSKLAAVSEIHTSLATQKLNREDISALTQFAVERRMVQTRNAQRLFADRSFALKER